MVADLGIDFALQCDLYLFLIFENYIKIQLTWGRGHFEKNKF